MKDRYIIDREILGMLLGLSEDKLKDSAYNDYMGRTDVLVEKAIENYAREKGLSNDWVTKIKAKLSESILNNESAEETMDSAVDDELKQNITKELQDKIMNLINELNKFIYESYMKKLEEDQRKKVEDYVNEMKSSVNSVLDFMKTYVEVFGEDAGNAVTVPKINLTPPSAQSAAQKFS
ncbi:hypothetical protein JW796_00615 [Candidatus Dojkabacteria bacterium]|nr:hypothetical protein [Candidatus Dojkabacteria bacterium]